MLSAEHEVKEGGEEEANHAVEILQKIVKSKEIRVCAGIIKNSAGKQRNVVSHAIGSRETTGTIIDSGVQQ